MPSFTFWHYELQEVFADLPVYYCTISFLRTVVVLYLFLLLYTHTNIAIVRQLWLSLLSSGSKRVLTYAKHYVSKRWILFPVGHVPKSKGQEQLEIFVHSYYCTYIYIYIIRIYIYIYTYYIYTYIYIYIYILYIYTYIYYRRISKSLHSTAPKTLTANSLRQGRLLVCTYVLSWWWRAVLIRRAIHTFSW